MTMPNERTRAMVWAGAFLRELARNTRLPAEVRRTAVFVARHYPTVMDIVGMAAADERRPFFMPMLEPPTDDDIADWLKDFRQGALTSATHLELPPEPPAKTPRRKPGKQP